MRRRVRFILCLALGAAASSPGAARWKAPNAAEVQAWAACAAERNADDIKWEYMLRSGQSGLEGRSRDGAMAYSIFLMARGCAPEGTGFDGKTMSAFSDRALALWRGDLQRHSLPREIDSWADCMMKNRPEKARAYLFARDFSFAGPKLIVQGVDPVEALFDPDQACDGLKPPRERIGMTDLYARLNYLARVEPRLRTAVVDAAAGARN